MMKEILTVLFRRKWHVIGCFLMLAGLPVLLSYVLPARYEATATLLLTPGRYKKPFVPTERDSRTPFMQVSMEDVGSEVEILLSRPVLAEVVDRTHLDRDCEPSSLMTKAGFACAASQAFASTLRSLGLTADIPAREAAIDRLHRKVDVEFVKRTNVIEVSWRGSTPTLARDVVNALVDSYLTHHLQVHGNTSALDAIERQAADDSKTLQDAEARLSAYSSKHAISDIETQHAELLAKLSDAESKVNILKGLEGRDVPGDGVGPLAGDPAFTDLSHRLTDAELRRVELSSKFNADATQVVSVNREIDQLRRLIRDRVGANLEKWRVMADTYRRDLAALDAGKVEVDRMRREIAELTDRERLSRENLADVVMSKGLDQAEVASVKVVQGAEAQNDPAFPKRLLILIISVFLGLVLAPAWGIAVDRMSGKVVSVHDLETTLGLPVLASIPEYDAARALPCGDPGTAEPLAGCLRRDLIPVEKTLGLDRPGARGAYLVTSPSRGAGTSAVAAALARAAAERGPGTTLLLSVQATPRGAIAAAGEVDPPAGVAVDPPAKATVAGVDVERMVVPAASGAMTDAAGGAEALIERARTRGAHVIVDVPGGEGDPLFLKFLPNVDAVVLVAAHDRTGLHPLARMADLIRRHGGRIAGCVFNRRKNPIPDWIYRRLFW
jgi:uncharacterized protein involved in exopolysaccharide biosynthesis/Mrp family chromosome partitioning ATPase